MIHRKTLPVLMLAALASCQLGTHPPKAPIRGGWTLGGTGGKPRPASEPLAVVFAAPRGETTEPPEISIVFNQPMRPLGLPPDQPPPPVVLEPPVAGAFHWLGTSAIRFDPKSPLPFATRFRLRVPAGTRSFDGSSLADGFEVAFSTNRPAPSRVTPTAEDEEIAPGTPVGLCFNMVVSEPEILRTVSLRHGTQTIPFDLDRQRPEAFHDRKGRKATSWDERCVRIVPKKPLPLSADLELVVDGSLRGAEGDLTQGVERRFPFHTVRAPRVSALSCEAWGPDPSLCQAAYPPWLELTSSVPTKALRSAITIEPPAAWADSMVDDLTTTYALSIDAAFEQGPTYRVRLDPAKASRPLVDEYGQRLSSVVERVFRFVDPKPAPVVFGARGHLWPRSSSHTLPIRAYGVDGFRLRAAPLSLDDLLRPAPAPPVDKPEPDKLLEAGLGHQNVDLDQLLGPAQASGPVRLSAEYSRHGEAERHKLAQDFVLTELGISARVAWGSAAVLVTHLETGAPVPNADVFVFRIGDEAKARPRQLLGHAMTDASGLATIALDASLSKHEPLAIVAKTGSDWTMGTLNGPAPPETIGSLYTDRNIYRPGETIHVAGALRIPTARGLRVPRGEEVTLVLEGSEESPTQSSKVTLSAFGTFSTAFELPRNANVGAYGIRVDGEHIWSTRLLVAEYRPTAIAASTTLDRPSYHRGDTLVCSGSAKYLHGSPLAGGKITGEIRRARASFQPPGYPSVILDPPQSLEPTVFHPVQKALDTRGSVAVPVKLAMADQLGPEDVTCELEFHDLDQQTLTDRATAIVHPADVYAALLPSSAPETSTTHEVLVLGLTPEGDLRSVPVHVEAERRFQTAQGKWQSSVLGKCDLTTGPEPVSCPIHIPKGPVHREDHLFVRARAVDTQGRAAESSYVRTIFAPRPVDSDPEPDEPPPPRFEMFLSKEPTLGTMADVTLDWPFPPAKGAMVTVEREGILWQRAISLPTGTSHVRFPVTPEMLPGGTVFITAMNGRVAERRSAEFLVNPSSRALSISIDTNGEAHQPGEEIEVGITVNDAAKRPVHADVTLYAADEATLSLGFYSAPAPFARFFDKRYPLGNALESRDDLVVLGLSFGRLRPPSVTMGAGQVGARDIREDFRQTAFFVPHLLTDAQGQVHHRVRLPDSLTTYRVFAVAVSEDDQAGTTESKIQTNLPLMVRATIPRVVREGDRFEAQVVISTRDVPQGPISIRADAQGLGATNLEPRTLSVTPDIPSLVSFPFVASKRGPFRARFQAVGAGGIHDEVALSGTVSLATPPEVTSLDGETRDAVAVPFANLDDLVPDFGQLSLTLSPTPLSGLREGMEQLLEYPYGCTEQTVSRLVPMLALRDLAESLGVGLPPDIEKAATESIHRILGHQQPDGGFGAFRESEGSDPFLSAYAVFGLEVARRHGLAVPPEPLARAHTYLRQAAFPKGASPKAHLEGEFRAILLDLAALSGHPNDRALQAIFEGRAELSLAARAFLLHAMAGRDAQREAELLRSLESSLSLSGQSARAVDGSEHAHALHSETRTTALVLRAIVASQKGHPLIPKLVAGLLQERPRGRFRTTQEAAWALLALDDVRRAAPTVAMPKGGRVYWGDILLGEASFDGGAKSKALSLEVPLSALLTKATAGTPALLTFEANKGSLLSYSAQLRYAHQSLPREPLVAGFFVDRTVAPLHGTSTSKAPLAASDLALVEVNVVATRPHELVVVESPLPGGLEPVVTDLRMGGSWLNGVERNAGARREVHDDRVVYFFDSMPAGITQLRYVARATVPGRFVTPPARAEEMYAPEISGRTAWEETQISKAP